MSPYRTHGRVSDTRPKRWLVAVSWGPAWGFWELTVTRWKWLAMLRAHLFLFFHEWGTALCVPASPSRLFELRVQLQHYPMRFPP